MPTSHCYQIWRNCPFTQGLAEARGWGRSAHFTLLISASAGSVFQKPCLVLFPWKKKSMSSFKHFIFLLCSSIYVVFLCNLSKHFLINNSYQYFWQARFLKEGLDRTETLPSVHIFSNFWPKYPWYIYLGTGWRISLFLEQTWLYLG